MQILSPSERPMSTFRRLDRLFEGKTSDQLAGEVAARRKRAEQDQDRDGRGPDARGATDPPRPRPLAAHTSGGATEGIYGLVLALSVIAVSWYYGRADAGRVGLSVLGTAVVFWLAHVYAYVLGRDMSRKRRVTRAEVVQSLRENFSLIEVVIPLLLVLGLGEIHVIADTAAIVAATVLGTAELAAAGGYAAARHGASRGGVIAAAAVGMGVGLIVVLLKALAYTH